MPFRLAMEGLSVGTHTIHINYDVTAGGHKAYDFLATWNVTNAEGKICAPSGGGDLVDVPDAAGIVVVRLPDRLRSSWTACRSRAPRPTRPHRGG